MLILLQINMLIARALKIATNQSMLFSTFAFIMTGFVTWLIFSSNVKMSDNDRQIRVSSHGKGADVEIAAEISDPSDSSLKWHESQSCTKGRVNFDNNWLREDFTVFFQVYNQ